MTETAFRKALLRWGRDNSRDLPWRLSNDPYAVLIGEVLLQRTRAANVAPVYARFLDRWPIPSALGRAREASISSVIRPLGLAKRASSLRQLGRELASLDEVPADPERLRQLPGVGRYAAHAVPIFARGRDLPLVDWVIARVLRRYFGLAQNKRPNSDAALWELAERLASAGRARALWLATLDFAAAICAPRPRCPECPLRRDCAFYQGIR